MSLGEAGLLPPLPAALLAGRDRDLLAPLPFLGPGESPDAPPPEADRGALARAVGVANSGYGHPRAEEAAGLLADPASRVVVAGQQPGLLGGPLYTLSKAVAASLWAERLAAAGRPAVAVFWVATEDHDFAEMARATVLAPEGPRTLDLGEDPSPLTPAGMRTLGPAVSRVLAELREAMPGDRYGAWVERLSRWYRPEARLGEAFCRLLVDLLGERCPLLVDAMLPEVKAGEAPWLRLLVERRRQVEEALTARDGAIEGRGYPLQVTPAPGAAPLFVLHGAQRRRVEWEGEEGYSLRGRAEVRGSAGELLELLEDNPGAVSPGVLARPAVQDALLGTSLKLVGPGELSYMPQAAPLYEVLGCPLPRVAMRPQVLVLEEHQIDKLAELGIPLADLVSPDLDLDRALAGRRGEGFVAPARRRIGEALEELKAPAAELDPNLEGPWEKTRDQVAKALEAFAGRVTAAAARQDEVRRQRAADLRAACRPLGELQERVVACAHFPGKYGERFGAAFFEQLEVGDPENLQVICP